VRKKARRRRQHVVEYNTEFTFAFRVKKNDVKEAKQAKKREISQQHEKFCAFSFGLRGKRKSFKS